VNVSFQKLVNREVNEICDYYDAKSPGLGDRFLHEVLSCIESIKANPYHWPPLADGSDKRKAQLKTFPYVVVYRVLDARSLRVLIVKHSRRDPGLGARRK
jgi:plasmid stabilization system protein ParE